MLFVTLISTNPDELGEPDGPPLFPLPLGDDYKMISYLKCFPYKTLYSII